MKINITVWLMVVLTVFLFANQALIMEVRALSKTTDTHNVSIVNTEQTMAQAPESVTDEKVKQIYNQVIPAGVPEKYGSDLGVSFDQAAAAIPILSRFEQDTREKKLAGEKLLRYINIGQQTACEYCCGATTMVFKDGRKACGCAHSAAMRGVAAYLLDNFPEMSDQDILAEVNKWKAVFFPRQTVEKALSVSSGGKVDMNALNKLSLQVGGC